MKKIMITKEESSLLLLYCGEDLTETIRNLQRMKEELSAFGVTLDVGENTVDVAGSLRTPSRTLSSHNDHRIAMALSVLCSVTGGEIDDALAVNKSYPGFFRDIGKLGIEVETHDA